MLLQKSTTTSKTFILILASLALTLVILTELLSNQVEVNDFLGRRRKPIPYLLEASQNQSDHTDHHYCTTAKMRSIVFHKTHKCSSTTMQNILFRFASNHDLNVALPDSGNYVGNLSGFSVEAFQKMSKRTQHLAAPVDIFCLHNRWNGSEVAKMFTKPVTYFTIVRNPIDVFISLWDYNQMGKSLHLSLEQFAFLSPKPKPASIGQMFPRNTMLFDFGLQPEQMDDMDAVQAKIQEVEDTFDLVMVVEHFDESLVLLNQLLCWEYSNFTYIKLNSHKVSTKSKLSPQGRAKLRHWLKADFLLYDHFVAAFHKKVASLGKSKMTSQLALLEKFNAEAQKDCGFQQIPNEYLIPRERLYGSGVMAYRVQHNNKPKCALMAMDEMKFINRLRASQAKRYKNKKDLLKS